MSSALFILCLCVVINSLIGVVFKLFARYKINTLYAIVINYATCVITGSIFFGEWTITSASTSHRWFPVSMGLGFIFVLVFNLYAHTVKHFGIVVSTIFQKMSMLAPAVIAIAYYGEMLSWTKALGILIGILSIGFLSLKSKSGEEVVDQVDHIPFKYWLLPLGTLVGSCLIDSTLYLLEAEKIAPSGNIEFVIHLFFAAFVAGIIMIILRLVKTRQLDICSKDVIAGIALGIPNFFSIYLLLLVIASGWEGSVVFPVNNVGILSVSAIFGFIIFKEKLTKNKFIGLSLSILAIILISN